jgi:sulfide:quinone oxidoreductase
MEVHMRRLLILGAGTAGTIAANKLRRRLGGNDWAITVVDHNRVHLYRPGLLAVPFGEAGSEDVVRPHRRQLHRGIDVVVGEIDRVVPHAHHVVLDGGRRIEFDYLVIATGAAARPDRIPGLVGAQWRRSVHEFSSLIGALALRGGLHRLARSGGRLVAGVAEQSTVDCDAALEFLGRADTHLRRLGVRDSVELVYAAARIERIEAHRQAALCSDGREIAFDLLVMIPPKAGADYIGRSRLGDGRNFVPVDPDTLQSLVHADIFALGAAAGLPAAEDRSAAQVSAAVFADNFVRHAAGLGMAESFSGRIAAHSGAGAARPDNAWLYWHVLLPGRPLPPVRRAKAAAGVAR